MFKNNILPFIVAVLLLGACRKMDDYKERYLQGGSITYAGKIDSVKAHPGDGRIMISGLLIADPKITNLKIYWDNKADSFVMPISRTSGVDTVRAVLNNMAESVKTFTIITFDQYGNKSVDVTVTGRIYGEVYKSLLLNRTVAKAEMLADSVIVDWNVLDASTGGIGSELQFTDKNDVVQNVFVKRSETKTILKNFKAGTVFTSRTLFLPDTLAIDTFYSRYQTTGVRADVTNQYIKNAGSPFNHSSSNGRWRIPADWTTTDDVKNAGGFGGIDAAGWLPSPALSMEAGWGIPTVPNGKIYQTLTLPAGRYSFEVQTGDVSVGGTKYITLAKGNTLPDIDNVPTEALKFAGITRNVNNIFSFELTEATEVSLGFQGKLPDSGTFFKIFRVRLFSLP